MDLKKAAEAIRKAGAVDGDVILAHISRKEEQRLKKAGGSGKKDPKTGLPHFSDVSDDSGSDSDSDSGSDTGSDSGSDSGSDGGSDHSGLSLGTDGIGSGSEDGGIVQSDGTTASGNVDSSGTLSGTGINDTDSTTGQFDHDVTNTTQSGGLTDTEAAAQTMGTSTQATGSGALEGGTAETSQGKLPGSYDSGTGYKNETSGAYGDLSGSVRSASVGARIAAGFQALFGIGTLIEDLSTLPGIMKAGAIAKNVSTNVKTAATGMKTTDTFKGTNSTLNTNTPTETRASNGNERASGGVGSVSPGSGTTVGWDGSVVTPGGGTTTPPAAAAFDYFTALPRDVMDWESLFINRPLT